MLFPFCSASGTIALDNQSQGTDATGGSQLVDGSRDNPGVPNRNDRKKRSKAWEEFSITEDDADGKPLKAQCTYCHTVVRCETTKGTSVLHNHLKSENCKRKRAAIEQAPIPSRYYLSRGSLLAESTSLHWRSFAISNDDY
jgi:hypothetical protein